jgi:hypothetical protein
MIFIFIEINFSPILLNFFGNNETESFGDYYDANTQLMNIFQDPRNNNPVHLLNNSTVSSGNNGDSQSFNEINYLLGDSPDDFLTTQLLQSGLNTQSSLSQTELNTICQSIGNENCAASSYCTLVGDRISTPKCLPGNARGPYVNYSDINVDYYYYQNRCYGNCPGDFYGNNWKPVDTTIMYVATVTNSANNTNTLNKYPSIVTDITTLQSAILNLMPSYSNDSILSPFLTSILGMSNTILRDITNAYDLTKTNSINIADSSDCKQYENALTVLNNAFNVSNPIFTMTPSSDTNINKMNLLQYDAFIINQTIQNQINVQSKLIPSSSPTATAMTVSIQNDLLNLYNLSETLVNDINNAYSLVNTKLQLTGDCSTDLRQYQYALAQWKRVFF